MISLKKYLDMEFRQSTPEGPQLQVVEAETTKAPGDCNSVALDCYRSELLAFGKTAVHGFTETGAELEKGLKRLESQLPGNPTPQSVLQTHDRVGVLLQEWGERTAAHLKGKTDEVKELLIALARTADSVGSRDHRYANKLTNLVGHIETISDLDDLSLIRSGLIACVSELKNSVEQLTKESEHLAEQLRAEVSRYETRLKRVEHLISRDEVSGAANRRSAEERIQSSIDNRQTFSILMLDLNEFKGINDSYGHLAGDQILKQFAEKLQMNTRPADLVCRWGGDEFMVILACSSSDAKFHLERISQTVFGEYSIQPGAGNPIDVHVDAALGLAQWHPGETMLGLVKQADGLMYEDKRQSRDPSRLR